MTTQARPLSPGDEAPGFSLRDQHGGTVSLSSYRGSRAVLLVFYPWAFSRVCTDELHELRNHLTTFDTEAVALLAVSCDPMFCLRAYAEEGGLTFPLLSDHWPHGAVARSYGVFDEATGAARRSSFVIDRAGAVRWSVHNAVGEPREPSQYARALTGLDA